MRGEERQGAERETGRSTAEGGGTARGRAKTTRIGGKGARGTGRNMGEREEHRGEKKLGGGIGKKRQEAARGTGRNEGHEEKYVLGEVEVMGRRGGV